MNSRTTDAIVLRWYPYRSFDRRVIAYTRDLGKVDSVARGTQRMTSKLAGSLEPLRLIQLSIAHGPKNDQVIGAVAVEIYRSLTERLERFAAASTVAELVDQLVKPYHPDERIFQLLLGALRRLNDPAPVFRGFVDLVHLQLLAALGYAPELSHCIVTGVDSDEGVFDADAGGFVSAASARRASLPRITRHDRAKLDELIRGADISAGDPDFTPALYREFRRFVMAKLDHPLRSAAFLEGVLRDR